MRPPPNIPAGTPRTRTRRESDQPCAGGIDGAAVGHGSLVALGGGLGWASRGARVEENGGSTSVAAMGSSEGAQRHVPDYIRIQHQNIVRSQAVHHFTQSIRTARLLRHSCHLSFETIAVRLRDPGAHLEGEAISTHSLSAPQTGRRK